MRQLVADGVPVRAAVRSARSLDCDVETAVLNVEEPRSWPAALAGVRAMFLLWPPGTAFASTVFPLIDAAVDAGVERIAFLSVLGADRMGFLPHAKIEAKLMAASVQTVILRAGYFFQNFSTMHADDIRDDDHVFLPTGGGRISMVDVEDVAAAARVGLTGDHGDVAWDLTGPAALSADDVADALTSVLGRPVVNAKPGLWRFYRSHIRRGTDPFLARFMCAEYTHARLGLAGRLGTGVRDALGREPTSFEEFARRSAAVWAR